MELNFALARQVLGSRRMALLITDPTAFRVRVTVQQFGGTLNNGCVFWCGTRGLRTSCLGSEDHITPWSEFTAWVNTIPMAQRRDVAEAMERLRPIDQAWNACIRIRPEDHGRFAATCGVGDLADQITDLAIEAHNDRLIDLDAAITACWDTAPVQLDLLGGAA